MFIMKKLVIAIDGPAGAGKSSISKALTLKLGYSLLDTGAIYRSLAWKANEKNVSWQNEEELAVLAEELDIAFKLMGDKNHVFLGSQDISNEIRTPEISKGASLVSSHPKVRKALLGLQRKLGTSGGIIAEGRDVGTVVFPSADIKFFLTASSKERAKRRTQELKKNGKSAEFSNVLKEIEERDRRDSSRDCAPLKAADDAIMIDSSSLTLDEVLEKMISAINERQSKMS